VSTQRYISTSFWDDAWIQTLDPSEKLFYLYLMTNPLTNIAGVYKITDRRISFDTGFNVETVKIILDSFAKEGKAYRISEYIAIPAWPKHQKWETSEKIKEGIVLALMELGEENLRKLVEMNYRFDLKIVFDRLCIPYIYSSNYLNSDSDSDSDLNSDRDRDRDTDMICADSDESTPHPQPEQAEPENHNTEKPHCGKTTAWNSTRVENHNVENPQLLKTDQDTKDLILNTKNKEFKNLPTEPKNGTAIQALPVQQEQEADSTAVAVAQKPVVKRSAKSKTLTDAQKALFHAAKACFENSEVSKALIYQDPDSTARELANLKTFVIRCSNMAPNLSADFMRCVLEHFAYMVSSGALRGKCSFTPRSIVTSWIWEMILASMPKVNKEEEEMLKSLEGMFTRGKT